MGSWGRWGKLLRTPVRPIFFRVAGSNEDVRAAWGGNEIAREATVPAARVLRLSRVIYLI